MTDEGKGQVTYKMADQHIGDFEDAQRLVREAVKRAAALSSDPMLTEWATVDDPAQFRPSVVNDALRVAWPDAPGTDLPAVQTTLQKLGDEVARVRRIQDATAVDPAAMPALTKTIVRHVTYAVRSLVSALHSSASEEQSARSVLTYGIAESVVALAEHVEWVQKLPTR